MNITKLEEQALKTLMNDNSIVIRPADKGYCCHGFGLIPNGHRKRTIGKRNLRTNSGTES